jgi:hypothetical protein
MTRPIRTLMFYVTVRYGFAFGAHFELYNRALVLFSLLFSLRLSFFFSISFFCFALSSSVRLIFRLFDIH